jgi:ABC-type branched-subunit amino acid transport system permease subunit
MRPWRRESALDLYNLVLAAVLLVCPWLFTLTNMTARIDLWASSLAVILISLAAIAAFAKWEEWANLILGIWLIASPWILGFTHTRAMHFSIGIGLAIAFLSALVLFLLYDTDQEHQPHGRASEPN